MQVHGLDECLGMVSWCVFSVKTYCKASLPSDSHDVRTTKTLKQLSTASTTLYLVIVMGHSINVGHERQYYVLEKTPLLLLICIEDYFGGLDIFGFLP